MLRVVNRVGHTYTRTGNKHSHARRSRTSSILLFDHTDVDAEETPCKYLATECGRIRCQDSARYHSPHVLSLMSLLAAVVRFAEPLALTSVFPYLPEMIKSFGIPENNVAKWAGIVGSTFSVSQSMFAVGWGRLSDKIGRKPTILIGLINVMFCFIFWGTSKSLAQALVARFLMGLCNGNGTCSSHTSLFFFRRS